MKQKESEEHILRTNYAEKKAFFLCKSLLIQEYIQFGCEFLQIIFFPICLIFPLSKVKSPSILWNITLNFPKCQTRRTQSSSSQSDLAPLMFHSGVDFARRT